MKFLFILILCPLLIFSQKDTTRSNTFLGQVNLRIGTIIKKEYSDLYKWDSKKLFNQGNSNIIIQSLIITDAVSGIKAKGLYVNTISTSGEYSAYIDSDEIEGLLKYIDFVTHLNPSTESNEVEYIFNSRVYTSLYIIQQ